MQKGDSLTTTHLVIGVLLLRRISLKPAEEHTQVDTSGSAVVLHELETRANCLAGLGVGLCVC